MLIGLSGKYGVGKDLVGNIIQYLTTRPDMSYSSFILLDKKEQEYIWKVKKFAGKLKEIASILTGIPIEKFEDQEFKKLELGEEWWYKNVYDTGWDKKWTTESVDYPTKTSTEDIIIKPTYREILQKIGTEAMRNNIHPNVWINALFADYKFEGCKNNGDRCETPNGDCNSNKCYPNWIITDVRFPNELQAIKKRGGITIRINRNTNPCVCVDDAALDCLVQCNKKQKEHISEKALDNAEFDYVIENNSDINNLITKVKDILTLENIL